MPPLPSSQLLIDMLGFIKFTLLGLERWLSMLECSLWSIKTWVWIFCTHENFFMTLWTMQKFRIVWQRLKNPKSFLRHQPSQNRERPCLKGISLGNHRYLTFIVYMHLLYMCYTIMQHTNFSLLSFIFNIFTLLCNS